MVPMIMRAEGKSLNEVLDTLAEQSGLLGLSGISGDIRDLEIAASQGKARARLALDVFTTEIRRYLGGLLVELGGADVIVFTGGIGENGVGIRQAICHNLEWAGIVLDPHKNPVRGKEEKISSVESDTEIWIVPTNEELIVARQTVTVLNAN